MFDCLAMVSLAHSCSFFLLHVVVALLLVICFAPADAPDRVRGRRGKQVLPVQGHTFPRVWLNLLLKCGTLKSWRKHKKAWPHKQDQTSMILQRSPAATLHRIPMICQPIKHSQTKICWGCLAIGRRWEHASPWWGTSQILETTPTSSQSVRPKTKGVANVSAKNPAGCEAKLASGKRAGPL